MKKLLTLLLLIAITLCGTSQSINNSGGQDETDYLKKSRHQKTAAWLLLGGGLLSASVGSVETNPDYGGTDNSNRTVFLVAGLAAIGVSIPLFIASAHNKHKAASLSLKTQPAPLIHKGSLVYQAIPSLTLKFRL